MAKVARAAKATAVNFIVKGFCLSEKTDVVVLSWFEMCREIWMLCVLMMGVRLGESGADLVVFIYPESLHKICLYPPS